MKRPVALGEHLRRVITDLGLEKRVEKARIFSEWADWVGDPVSKHTEPVKIKHGKLYVKVENDAWRSELIYQKFQLIRKINDRIGREIVKDILFI